ncbi:MAG: hypothetical protein ACD_73C00226G0003 [uncultured bacterium]|nr:MAG: hypothetical protein ACD_73C00226G0003 [uncultured bacterium]
MSDDSGFCKGGWNPICWPLVVLAPLALLSGCSDESDEITRVVEKNNGGDAGTLGSDSGSPINNQDTAECKLPDKNADGTQTYYKDVFITDEPTSGNQCKKVQAALEIADKNGATVHFIRGSSHKENFIVNTLFKKLTFVTDFNSSSNLSVGEAAKNVPAILTGDEHSQAIMSFDEILQPQNVPMIEIRDLTFMNAHNATAIHMIGGYKPMHEDEFNLKLYNVKIQGAKRGLVVDNKARILADNLDVAYPDQAISLGSQTESEFYGLKIHDMAIYSAKAVFEAIATDSVKIEKALFSNLGSEESILNIQTNLAWIYGVEFINNRVVLGSVLQLDLGELFKSDKNQEHRIGNILIANNDAAYGSVINYRTADKATFHNLDIHRNEGEFMNVISSDGSTAVSSIINSSITDNGINLVAPHFTASEAITSVDSTDPGYVAVHGTNIYNNLFISGVENIYGPDNYSIPHCGKSELGIIYNYGSYILFPDAFDLNTTDHEQCALAKGGVAINPWMNNEDGSLGNVGVTGGWKAHLMPDVYQFVTDLYKNTINP